MIDTFPYILVRRGKIRYKAEGQSILFKIKTMVMVVTSLVKNKPSFLQPQASTFEALPAIFTRNRKKEARIEKGKHEILR